MLTRDLERARKAYEAVGSVPDNDRRDYKIAVHSIGAEVQQDGLAAAIAGLERRENRAKLLREHLAKAGIPGLHQPNSQEDVLRAPATADNLPGKIRALELDDYILGNAGNSSICPVAKSAPFRQNLTEFNFAKRLEEHTRTSFAFGPGL